MNCNYAQRYKLPRQFTAPADYTLNWYPYRGDSYRYTYRHSHGLDETGRLAARRASSCTTQDACANLIQLATHQTSKLNPLKSLTVANDETPFEARDHPQTLPFFDPFLRASMAEQASKCFRLPDDEVDGIAIVVGWLYFPTINPEFALCNLAYGSM